MLGIRYTSILLAVVVVLASLFSVVLQVGGGIDECDTVDVLITFHEAPGEIQIKRITELCFEILYSYKYIDTILARGPESAISAIVSLDFVSMVEVDSFLYMDLDVSSSAVKARPSTVYRAAWEEFGVTGEGVNVAVLDSGVDDHLHMSFPDKFVGGADFSGQMWNTNTNPSDGEGHGTSVAGIILGTGDGFDDDGDGENDYIGVAPGSKLVDVKVSTAIGRGRVSSSGALAAMEWCIDNRLAYRISLLSLSFSTGIDSDGTGSMDMMANEIVNNGMVVIAAMGNDGERKVPSPASAEKVIAVGGIDDRDTVDRSDDIIADYSNYGPRSNSGPTSNADLKPDLVAPGTGIMTPLYNTRNVYVSVSGTSASTPHVSGAVALMLEANPLLSTEQVKTILRQSSEPRGNPYDEMLDPVYNDKYGWGILDAHAAVSMALETPPPDITPHLIPRGDGSIEVAWDMYQGTGFMEYDLFLQSGQSAPISVFSTNNKEENTTVIHDLLYDTEYHASVKLSTWNRDHESTSIVFSIDESGAIEGNIPPEAFIHSIYPLEAFHGESITFSGTGYDSDGYITAYRWSSSISGVLSDRESFSTSTLSIGTHQITFRVMDNGGTWSQPARETVVILRPEAVISPPIISITSPIWGEDVGVSLNITGTVSSHHPLDSVFVLLDGVEYQAQSRLVSTGNYSWHHVLNLSGYEGKKISIGVFARDSEGMESDVEYIEVKVTSRGEVMGLAHMLGSAEAILIIAISSILLASLLVVRRRRRRKKNKGFKPPQVYVIERVPNWQSNEIRESK